MQVSAQVLDIGGALDDAIRALRQAQVGDHWVGRLSSSALATGMSMAALHTFDRTRDAAAIDAGRHWLVATQLADGGWGDAVIDPANINATSLALAALKLTQPDSPPLHERTAYERALECLDRDFGGFEAVGDPSRCTLSGPCRTLAALAGLMDWSAIKRLRPEVALIPRRWRRTISTTFPAYLSISTLHSRRAPHGLNVLPTYQLALRCALDWLAQAQASNGSFEESAFLTSVIVTCLVAAGYRHLPWLEPAIDFVLRSQRSDGSWPIDRDLETFDSDLAVFAFREAGLPVPDGGLVRDWFLQNQFSEPCFATEALPGGWAWAQPGGWPDTDDTAYTILALLELGVPATSAAITHGTNWLAWMQGPDGAWSTFVRGSRMPFDHDCPYITGHALSALHAAGRLRSEPVLLDRALGYLQRTQRPDGSFASIWFRESTAGTASVLEAVCDVGLQAHPVAVGARHALLANQNGDASWGGMRGQSGTAEETAWAVLALLATGDPDAERAALAGADWLAEHQTSDGTWPAAPIGLYFSAMWYADSMYALALPARALARAAQRTARRA